MRDEILKRYPYLVEVPPDAPLGKDTPLPPPPPISWDGLGTVIPVNPPPPPPPEPEQSAHHEGDTGVDAEDQVKASSEESREQVLADPGVQEDDTLTTWHDVALSIAAELMAKVRQDIHTKLGYTMTAVCRPTRIQCTYGLLTRIAGHRTQ